MSKANQNVTILNLNQRNEPKKCLKLVENSISGITDLIFVISLSECKFRIHFFNYLITE